MSNQAQIEELLAVERRIAELQKQQQSPVETLRFPNGASVTYRSPDDVDRALRRAKERLAQLESPPTGALKARRVYMRLP